MKWRHVIPLALIVIGATGAILRSPKEQAAVVGKQMRKHRKVAVPVPPMPPVPEPRHPRPRFAFNIVKPPRPYHITLMCDQDTGANVIGYRWYRGSNSLPLFSSAMFTTNNWVTESNLWPGVNYEFVVAIVGTNGVESTLSPICRWPRAKTNFISLGVSQTQTGSWITNTSLLADRGNVNFRLQRVSNGYELHESPNFMAWTPVDNWPASAPLPTFYLRAAQWDNVSNLTHDD